LTTPASQRSQMSQQHRWRLRFRDERIHSRRGAFGYIDLPGKHEDGNVRMGVPDLAGYRLSVHPRALRRRAQLPAIQFHFVIGPAAEPIALPPA
jgi:hypothetical protein